MMRRFSSSVVRSTSVTCSVQVLPTTVQTGAPELDQRPDVGVVLGAAAHPAGGAEGGDGARSSRAASRARAKNSASLGFEPGQPPSMKATPSSSSRRAMRSLSSQEREIPSRWVPSRSVVS